ncbi:MAG: hypothetical protein K8F91_20345 [Candidatus Obscuribacterales bacterium]|nr:hypothetical protein [Candidatus Obscuribacterales bacterium]
MSDKTEEKSLEKSGKDKTPEAAAESGVIGGKKARENQSVYTETQKVHEVDGSATDLMIPPGGRVEKYESFGFQGELDASDIGRKDAGKRAGTDRHPAVEETIPNKVNTEAPVDVGSQGEDIMGTDAFYAIAESNPTAASVAEMLKNTSDPETRKTIKQAGTDVIRTDLEEQLRDLRAGQSDGDYADSFSLEEIQALENRQNIAEKQSDGSMHLNVGTVETEIIPEQLEPQEENTRFAWLDAAHRLLELPLEEQMQIVGAGLLAGADQYVSESRERSIGATIGTVQGLGELSVELATIVEFTCDVVAGNDERAILRGEQFGESLGKTIVGGIKLFEMADKYLFDIGFTGDYAKPFQDIATLAQRLNQAYDDLPPREKERIKHKLATEIIGDAALPIGAARLSKTEKFTTILEEMTTLGREAVSGTGQAVKMLSSAELSEKARETGRTIAGIVNDLLGPPPSAPGGLRPVFATGYGEEIRHQNPLGSIDNLAMEGSGDSLPGRLPDLPAHEAARHAIDEMVHPLPAFDTDRFAHTFENVAEMEDYLRYREEHFESMQNALYELSDHETVLELHRRDHRFHFGGLRETRTDLIGRSAGIPGSPGTLMEELPGFTEGNETFVPSRIFDAEQTRWIDANERTIFDVDGMQRPIRVLGVLRHEVGQAIAENQHWKDVPLCSNLYSIGRRRLEQRSEKLSETIGTLVGDLSSAGYSDTEIANSAALRTLAMRQGAFVDHMEANELGWEQTLADLFAISQGG